MWPQLPPWWPYFLPPPITLHPSTFGCHYPGVSCLDPVPLFLMSMM